MIEATGRVKSSIFRRQQAGDSFQWDADPSRAIVEFVAEFIDSFCQEVHFQQFGSFWRADGKIARRSRGLIILVKKAICRALAPSFRPAAKLGELAMRNETAFWTR